MSAKSAIAMLKAHFKQTVREAICRNGWGKECAVDAAPWSIEGLGPKRTNGIELARLDSVVLRDARLLTISSNGHPVHWHTEQGALVELFLDRLQGSDGVAWHDWLSAFEGFWSAGYFSVLAQPEDELAEDELDRDLAITRKFLTNIANDALERSWHDAFTSGRILVFADDRDGFVLQAPHVWSKAPPFPCPSLEDIRERFLRENTRNSTSVAPKSELAELLSLGLPAIQDEPFPKLSQALPRFDRLALKMGGLDESSLRETVQRAQFLGIDESYGRIEDQKQLAFLVSQELEQLFEDANDSDTSRKGGPGGRNRVMEINELIEWFDAGIKGGETWNRRKQAALREIQAEARRRDMKFAISRKAATEVWERTVPDEWKSGGSPKIT